MFNRIRLTEAYASKALIPTFTTVDSNLLDKLDRTMYRSARVASTGK